MLKERILHWYRKHSIIIGIIKTIIKDREVIIMVNGGICSQMQQYLIGLFLLKRGNKVEYDLDFYKGYTFGGALTRKFDLLKLCPQLDFKEADNRTIKMYKRLFKFLPQHKQYSAEWGNFLELPNAPSYIDGYYDVGLYYYRRFRDIFKIDVNLLEMDNDNKYWYERIIGDENSIGVHVRRGDMAVTGNYWKVLKPQYFVQAINCFSVEKMNFYFFSDERDWILENIIPILDNRIHYYFVDCNNSETGYLDLFLLSLCRHQIASQGSFGKYGWLLNGNEHKILVVPQTDSIELYKKISDSYQVIGIELNCENSEN